MIDMNRKNLRTKNCTHSIFVYYLSYIRILVNSNPDITEIVLINVVFVKLLVQFFISKFLYPYLSYTSYFTIWYLSNILNGFPIELGG
jgi:hypothetical protein